MQKTLRFLGLVAVIGAFAIVVAQQSSSARTQGAPLQSGGDTAIANTQSSGFSNHVLILMSQYFSFQQTMEIERAKERGRNDRVEPIIHANCAAMLWLQTPDQQERTIASWGLDTYRPNDLKWAEITRSPSLVRELLKVDKKTDAQVAKFIDIVWKPIMDQDREFEEQLWASPAFKNAKTQHEKNVLHYEGLKAWRAKHPLPPREERHTATLARYEKAMKDTEALLTPAQRKEMQMLRTKFDVAFKVAVRGDRP